MLHASGPVIPREARNAAISNTPHFKRTIGAVGATAINMTQMCGIGPFVTIPLIVKAMGGSQAIFAFLIGAFIAIADGLVWAELGAAMPGAGGTYIYLREAFQYGTGKLMPFLFVWTAMLFIPLIMSTGVIGLVQYLHYYEPTPVVATQPAADTAPTTITPTTQIAAAPAQPDTSFHISDYIAVTPWGALLSLFVCFLAVLLLYQKVQTIEKFAGFFFVVMLAAVAAVATAAYTHFHADLAFTFPKNAFQLPWHSFSDWWNTDAPDPTTRSTPVTGIFFLGLGVGLVNAVYDYAGYNTAAYMGAELKNPGKTIPRSIVFSILGMMAIYLTLQIGVLGSLPWQQIANSDSIGSLVLEHTWGKTAAYVFTALIVITAFASVAMGLLGGSRVPFNAAKDGLFFPIFGRLHPRLNFPHVALIVMAVIMAIGSMFSLGDVINSLTAVMVLVQALAQIAALTVLRKRQPDLRRPYKMTLYPLPSLLALIGWLYIYINAGRRPIELSLAWLVLGVVAFLIWASIEKTWPFGPKEIHEEFLSEERAGIDPAQ